MLQEPCLRQVPVQAHGRAVVPHERRRARQRQRRDRAARQAGRQPGQRVGELTWQQPRQARPHQCGQRRQRHRRAQADLRRGKPARPSTHLPSLSLVEI